MTASYRNKLLISITLLILLAVNILLLSNRKKAVDNTFSTPVPIGTVVNYNWATSDKEIIFVFVKPTCATCALYKDSLNSLFDKYSAVLHFNGLYNPKYWEPDYFKTFKFQSLPINSEIRNALHLAFTPQFILIENNKVTFVCNFRVEFNNEFIRLKKYLREKYAKQNF
jgi:thioredoxin-related protein